MGYDRARNGGIGLFVGREPALSVRDVGEKMRGSGAFVRRYRSEGWEVTDRLYGAFGEKSIDFRKILYRLFRKTL